MENIFTVWIRCWQFIILFLMYAFAIGMLLFPRETLWWLVQAKKRMAQWLKVSPGQIEVEMEWIQDLPFITIRRLRWFGLILLISTTVAVLIGIRRGAVIP